MACLAILSGICVCSRVHVCLHLYTWSSPPRLVGVTYLMGCYKAIFYFMLNEDKYGG